MESDSCKRNLVILVICLQSFDLEKTQQNKPKQLLLLFFPLLPFRALVKASHRGIFVASSPLFICIDSLNSTIDFSPPASLLPNTLNLVCWWCCMKLFQLVGWFLYADYFLSIDGVVLQGLSLLFFSSWYCLGKKLCVKMCCVCLLLRDRPTR